MTTGVALCTYNGAKYIKEQLISIINQTIKPNKIIIIDDCSEDNTLDLLYSLQKSLNELNIKIIKNDKNLGVKKSFAKAIIECDTDIVFLSDQDDLWVEQKIERIINFFNINTNKKVVFTNASLIDEAGSSYSEKSLFNILNFNEEAMCLFEQGFFYDLQNIQNRVTGATMAFYRSYIIEKNILPFNECHIYHDEIIAINACLDSCIGFINECLVQYRIYSNQVAGLDFINRPQNYIFKFHPLNLCYNLLREDNIAVEKIKFYTKRQQYINSYYGVFAILCYMHQYKRYYKNIKYGRYKALKSDLYDNFLCLRKRLKRINNKSN